MRLSTNLGCDVYMSSVLCTRSGGGWEWRGVGGGGQITEGLSLSAELLLRVPTGGLGVVTTLAFLTGRGREGLVLRDLFFLDVFFSGDWSLRTGPPSSPRVQFHSASSYCRFNYT